MKDRNGLEILSETECWELLGSERMGRLAVISADAPVIFPIHYGIHDGTIVFRSTPGTKLSKASAHAIACFEIDGHDFVNHEGWSVLVSGRTRIVHDTLEIESLEHLPIAWWRHQKADWIRVEPDAVTGRRIVR